MTRRLLLDATRGLAFVVDAFQAREFALTHWLVSGTDGRRLFVRCFDAGKTGLTGTSANVLASGATMRWNSAAKVWIAGAGMADASLNRRQSVRVIGSSVAFAQIGIVGFDGQVEPEAVRLSIKTNPTNGHAAFGSAWKVPGSGQCGSRSPTRTFWSGTPSPCW